MLESGDTAAAERSVAPDFINHEADDPDRSDRGIRGPAGLVATSRWLREVFSELRFDQTEAVGEGERVVVMVMMTRTHIGTVEGVPPTHKPSQQRRVHLFPMRDGQIVEHSALPDDLGLLRHSVCYRHRRDQCDALACARYPALW